MASKANPGRSVFRVSPEVDQLRLDQALAQCVPGLSRRMARVLIDLGGVFVDQKRVKVAGRRVHAGQTVAVHQGGAFERARKATGLAARREDESALPSVRVLYEDEHLLAVDKPAGLLSAPTPESDRNNLLSVLGSSRPGLQVVHRLDLQASGVMVLAKTELANHALAETFRQHTLVRKYDVFAAGALPANAPPANALPANAPPANALPAGTLIVDQPLRGKAARTEFVCLAQLQRWCHLEATLHTGRTHQIRLHLLHLGLPVLGEPRYAEREPWHPARLALHAKRLELAHHVTGDALHFAAELPSDLAGWLSTEGALQLPDPH